jgi:AraC-like DNA-binding protein
MAGRLGVSREHLTRAIKAATRGHAGPKRILDMQLCQELREHQAAGGSIEQAAVALRISVRTLRRMRTRLGQVSSLPSGSRAEAASSARPG